ncbi:MAG TPA: phosphatidate cytidylyltransferase [Fimbriimonadaceae bacterium]|nr:phosphatidate cytidylyltransferase [Fimbriimonadaceae bacterium]HRJ97461.1 phosphatidate cytidylyltransferase [Fimbriimonadaceae bacterium]
MTEARPRPNMVRRILTAVIAIPIVLAVLFSTSPWPILLLAITAWCFAFDELVAMVDPDRVRFVLIDAFWPVVAILAWVSGLGEVAVAVFGTMFISGLVGLARVSPTRKKVLPWAIGWITAPFGALIVLHEAGIVEPGQAFSANLALMALVPLWVGDTLAILAGRTLGRVKLAPRISPGKTLEGALANLAGCLAAAWALGLWLEVETWRWVAVGLTAGILGQVGDLSESALKRRFGVKDSGVVLPGHGGVLDRLDSFFLTAVPIAVILLWPATR